MTKRKLLEILKDVKDHEQIYIYNGFVDDHMDINTIQTVELVKQDRSFIRDMIELEHIRDRVEPWTEEQFETYLKNKKVEWEYPNQFVTEGEMTRWYGTKRKKVHLLLAKVCGKTYEDRIGKMYY